MHRQIFILSFLLIAFSSDASSVKDFINYPSIVDARIDPTGSKVVSIEISEGKHLLVMTHLDLWKREVLLEPTIYFSEKSYIRDLEWIDNRYVAMQLSEVRKGIERLVDTKLVRRLIIMDTQRDSSGKMEIFSVKTKGWFLGGLHKESFKFLYAKPSSNSVIYKLDVRKLHPINRRLSKLDRIDGGQFVASNIFDQMPGYVLRWYVDADFNVQSALVVDRENKIKLINKKNENEITVVHEWFDSKSGSEPRIFPWKKGKGEQVYYGLNFSDRKNKKVFLIDYSSNTQKVIYETSAYRIVDILLDSNQELYAVQIESGGRYEFEYVKHVNREYNSDIVDSWVSRSSDKTSGIAYYESHSEPGYYYLADAKGKKIKTLRKRYQSLDDVLPSTLVEGKTSVEGLEIPWLLSKPANVKSVPLIVMPHGGPLGVHDDPYYDSVTQLFVAQGFAVLRINYRGSSGYNSDFENAGKKQWGNLILKDIVEVIKTTLTRNDIDSKRVCMVGFSYGGYAAMILSMQYPDMFKCAVSVAGVSDINLLLNGGRITQQQRKWQKEHIGDSENEYDVLKSQSPIFNVNKLSSPIFIAHGLKDSVVDVEHAYRMKYMLQKYNKDFEFYIDQESGHSFLEMSNRRMLFEKIVAFLQDNI